MGQLLHLMSDGRKMSDPRSFPSRFACQRKSWKTSAETCRPQSWDSADDKIETTYPPRQDNRWRNFSTRSRNVDPCVVRLELETLCEFFKVRRH